MSENRVCDYLETHQTDILAEWEAAVRAELPKAAPLPRLVLRDHIPQMLQKLTQWLRADAEHRRHDAGTASADFGDIADFHAAERIEVGFDLRQVVTEYRILRRCILGRISRDAPTSVARDVTRLNGAIDLAIAESVSRYTEERDRQLNEAREEQFRLFVDGVTDYAIFLLDPKGNVATWNRGAERIKGYQAEEILGQHFSRFYPDRDVRAGKCERELEMAARDGRFEDEDWRIRKDGSRFWANVVITPIRDPKDRSKLIGFCKITRDLTERKKAEDEKLQLAIAQNASALAAASENQFRSMIEGMPVLAWSAKPDGVMEYYNPRWYEYTGTTPAEMERMGWQAVHDPEVLSGAVERWQHSLVSGEPFEMDFPLRRADGVFRWFLTRVMPLRGVSGEIVRWVGIGVEIDDQRRARSAAEAATKAKDEFLAMLGHELRNPLAPIQTALQLMRLRGVTAGQHELSIIERQVRHMVRLVDDLLDVSRITRGSIQLSLEHLNLADVTARAVEMASPLFEEREHLLSVDVPRELFIEGDAYRLAQVVSNLLTNAAKYTPDGGSIRVTAERVADEVVLHVRDSGVGISRELLPNVFDLFVQGRQGIDRSQGGLGIGLTIVRRFVDLHHGRVTVESEGTGRGATFSVHLPALDEARRVEAPASTSAAPIPVVPARRVLIVDDNSDAAEMLSELLQTVGCATHIANDGPSALQVVETFKPDIALLDIGLPVMNGYELARQVRQRPGLQGIRLIAVTGYGQQDDRDRARAAGFDDHLVKPVDVTSLLAAIGRAEKTG